MIKLEHINLSGDCAGVRGDYSIMKALRFIVAAGGMSVCLTAFAYANPVTAEKLVATAKLMPAEKGKPVAATKKPAVTAKPETKAKVAAKPKPAAKAKPTAKPKPAVTAKPLDWCKRLSQRLPGVSDANCRDSGLQPSGAVSHQGFPILSRHIPAAKSNKANHQPVRILLMGGIHGDELTASSIVFQWMEWVKIAPAETFHWSVAPVVNPDGLLARRPKRVNARGVDLNRNFPTPNWRTDAPVYWAKRTRKDPRRFPGVAPLSEPESRWVNEEMERFRPQVIISVHAPFGVLDFDGPVKPPHKFGRLVFSGVGVYPGSLGNYSGMHKNVPVITIELPNARAMPSQAEMKRIWLDMLMWIRQNVPEQEVTPVKRAVVAAN